MTPLDKQGIAEGTSDIKWDCVVFRFKDEVFEVPTMALEDVGGFYNGYFYEARIRRLRAWQRRDDVEKRNGIRKRRS